MRSEANFWVEGSSKGSNSNSHFLVENLLLIKMRYDRLIKMVAIMLKIVFNFISLCLYGPA